MENSVTLSLEDYNNLRDTSILYHKISTEEVAVMEYRSFGNGRNTFFFTNDMAVKHILLEKNKIVDILNEKKTEIGRLKMELRLLVEEKPKKINGFWNKLKFIIDGKICSH